MGRETYRYKKGSLPEGLRIMHGEEPILPCREIDFPEFQVGVLSDRTVNARRFLFEDLDRHPIRLSDESGNAHELTLPGKSAFLYLGPHPVGSYLTDLIGTVFDRKPISRDRCI